MGFRRTVPLVIVLLVFVLACKRIRALGGSPSAEPTAAAAPAPTGAGTGSAVVVPADGWSDDDAKSDLTLFYNTTAEWSGKFVLAKVLQMRVDQASDRIRVAHVEYAFEPVRGNPRSAGTDRRTFELVREDSKWVVKSMGANESASFGAEAEGWSDKDAIDAAQLFYVTRGEWKGKFSISRVLRYRVDRTGPGKKVAYLEYAFTPEPGNPRPAGVDKRSFHFSRAGTAWQLDRMGGFNSAAAAFKR